MKKLLLIGGGILAVGAIGWSALWYMGKGEVEQRVDFELAQLEARGWTVTYGNQSISGFPAGYQMDLTDVAATRTTNGLLVQFPQLTVAADASAPTRLVFTLPDTFTAALPIPDERRAVNPSLPRVLTIEGKAKNLVVVAEGLSPADRSVAATAASLDLIVDQKDYPSRVLLAFSGLDTGFMPRGDKLVSRMIAGTIGVDVATTPEDGQPSASQLSYSSVSLTGSGGIDAWSSLYEVVYGGAPGGIDGAFQTGQINGTVTVGTPDDPEGGSLTFAAATATGIYELTSGGIDVQSESRDNRWTLSTSVAADPFDGTITVSGLQARYRMPMAPTEAPSDIALKLSIDDLNADKATWDQFDPEGALPRGPANLAINIGGTAKVTKRFDELRPGEAPPFEVGNVIVDEIAMSALGASVRAAGDIEMLQPIGLPLGTLKVDLKGPKALIDALGKSGLVPAELLSMGDAILQVYAKPTDGEDEWETDVTFGEEGITINGLKVQ